MNKKHYNWLGDPLPELRDALAVELMKAIPRERFKPQFKKVYDELGIYTFKGLADDIIKTVPENCTLTVTDGQIQFTREDVKPDPIKALTDDALAEFTKDQGPADLQEAIDRGMKASTFKNFLE